MNTETQINILRARLNEVHDELDRIRASLSALENRVDVQRGMIETLRREVLTLR